MFSAKYRMDAYRKMAPLLRRQGRTQQAADAEASLASLQDPARKLPYLLSYDVGERAGRIVQLSGLFLFLLFAVTVAWLIALAILRWKPDLNAALNRLASVLCLTPLLLLLSGLALFLSYYPYARHIGQYVSLQELHQGFMPFIMGLYDFSFFGSFREPWLTIMFWPSVWCALVALVGASSLWLMRRLARPDNRGADAA